MPVGELVAMLAVIHVGAGVGAGIGLLAGRRHARESHERRGEPRGAHGTKGHDRGGRPY